MKIRRGVLALLLVTLAGCDVFKPATPEPPPPDPVPTDYSSPEDALTTIRFAVEAKGRVNAATAYEDAFGDSAATTSGGDGRGFWAFVEEAVLARFPRPGPTNFGEERQFYSKLILVSAEPYGMIWSPDQIHPDTPGDDDQVLHRIYRIETAPASGDPIVVARGIADLYFHKVLNTNRWVIVRWDDRVDPDHSSDNTLGILRLGSR